MVDDDDLAYFRFAAVDDLHVPQIDIAISLKQLQATPESLLWKRYEWNAEHAQADGAKNNNDILNHQPILLHPSKDPYKKDWCYDMGNLIVDAHAYFFNKKERESSGHSAATPLLQLKLPAGMELEVALNVLDYYGLTIENPRTEVSLENSNELIQIRAMLFLEQMELLIPIKDFIMDTLKTCPRRINYFIHCHNAAELTTLNATQNTSRNQQSLFIRLGNDANFTNFKEVLQEESIRNNLIAILGDVGLKAEFMEGCLNPDDEPSELVENGIRIAPTHDGKCWVATEPARGHPVPSETAWYGGKYEIEQRYVLRVEIPHTLNRLVGDDTTCGCN